MGCERGGGVKRARERERWTDETHFLLCGANTDQSATRQIEVSATQHGAWFTGYSSNIGEHALTSSAVPLPRKMHRGAGPLPPIIGVAHRCTQPAILIMITALQ